MEWLKVTCLFPCFCHLHPCPQEQPKDQVCSQLMGGGLHRHLLLQGLSLPGDLPSSSETYWVTQSSRPGYLCWLIGPEPLWPLLTWRGLELRGKGALGSAEPVLEARTAAETGGVLLTGWLLACLAYFVIVVCFTWKMVAFM